MQISQVGGEDHLARRNQRKRRLQIRAERQDVRRRLESARQLDGGRCIASSPPKHAMLRTSYMATHEREHLDRGLEAFRAVGKKYGVI